MSCSGAVVMCGTHDDDDDDNEDDDDDDDGRKYSG